MSMSIRVHKKERSPEMTKVMYKVVSVSGKLPCMTITGSDNKQNDEDPCGEIPREGRHSRQVPQNTNLAHIRG